MLTRDTEAQLPHPRDMPSCGGLGLYRKEELSVQESTVCRMSSTPLNPMKLQKREKGVKPTFIEGRPATQASRGRVLFHSPWGRRMRPREVMSLVQVRIACYGPVPGFCMPSLMLWAAGIGEGFQEEVRPELAP